MLAEHGVLAVSPEIGTNNVLNNQFFIGTKETLLEVIQQNYPYIKYMIMKIGVQLMVKLEGSNFDNNDQVFVKVANVGFSDIK